jgi:hypothetical protein
MLHKRSWFFLVLASLIVSSSIIAGCSSQSDAMAQMPDDVRSAPVSVQQAYQFAVANPEVMKQIPCYCGCGKVGHTSNYSCYVAGEKNGQIEYDLHAVGCSICVDITLDTMRLLKEGKSPGEIKAYVDSTYSKYGPSNIP